MTFTEKVGNYASALGVAWMVYLAIAVAMEICVLIWAFHNAGKVDTISLAHFDDEVTSKKLFHMVAYLNIGALVFMFIDFFFYEKGERSTLRLTPIPLLTLMLATFIEAALWTLDTDKKGKSMDLVLFQMTLNSVVLPVLFNQH